MKEVKGIDRAILRRAKNGIQLRLALESIATLPYLVKYLEKSKGQEEDPKSPTLNNGDQ